MSQRIHFAGAAFSLLPTAIAMSSSKGLQDVGNDKIGPSSELAAAAAATQPAEMEEADAILRHRERMERVVPPHFRCEVCHTGTILHLQHSLLEIQKYCIDCETRMFGRWMTV